MLEAPAPGPAVARPLLLFDLNGVLVDERKDGGKTRRKVWQLRPGIQRLLELRDRFELGVFSSAKSHTVQGALTQLETALGGSKDRPVFTRVLHRTHCVPDPHWKTRPEGKEWDTVKPLARNGLSLQSVLIVDNEPRKVLTEEHTNLITLPTWEYSEDQGAAAWTALIASLAKLPAYTLGVDLRQHVKAINTAVVAAAGTAQPEPQPQPQQPAANTGSSPPAKKQRTAAAATAAAAISSSQREPLFVMSDDSSDESERDGEKSENDDTDMDDGVTNGGTAGTVTARGQRGNRNGLQIHADTDLMSSDESEGEGEGSEGESEDWPHGVAGRADDGYGNSTQKQDYPRPPALRGATPLYSGPHRDTTSSHSHTHSHTNEELSALHYEIAAFASACAPSDAFVNTVSQCVERVQAAARVLWPESRAVVFGSQATGLALPGSDVDIVVLGANLKAAQGDAHTPAQLHARKVDSKRALLLLAKELKQVNGFTSFEIVKAARVPIIKARMALPGPPDPNPTTNLPPTTTNGRTKGANKPRRARKAQLCVDISIGAQNGVAAVALAQQCVLALPPLRPLVLVLKALLKQAKLNEVFTGGLSSYTLFNLVTSHLMCEGHATDVQTALANALQATQQQAKGSSQAAGAPGAGATQQQAGTTQQGTTQPQASATQQQQGKGGVTSIGVTSVSVSNGASLLCEGLCPDFLSRVQGMAGGDWDEAGGGRDLGDMLAALLARFGCVLDESQEAISVRRGGLCPRSLALSPSHTPTRFSHLVVEDPQQATHNVSVGSFNWPVVKRLLRCALQSLTSHVPAYDPCTVVPEVASRVLTKPMHPAKAKKLKAKNQDVREHTKPAFGYVDRVADLAPVLLKCAEGGPGSSGGPGGGPKPIGKRKRGRPSPHSTNGTQPPIIPQGLQAVDNWPGSLEVYVEAGGSGGGVGGGVAGGTQQGGVGGTALPRLIRASEGHPHLHQGQPDGFTHYDAHTADMYVSEADQWAAIQQDGSHRTHQPATAAAAAQPHQPAAAHSATLSWATQLPRLFDIDAALAGPTVAAAAAAAAAAGDKHQPQPQQAAGAVTGKRGAGGASGEGGGVAVTTDPGARLPPKKEKIKVAREARVLARQERKIRNLQAREEKRRAHAAAAAAGQAAAGSESQPAVDAAVAAPAAGSQPQPQPGADAAGLTLHVVSNVNGKANSNKTNKNTTANNDSGSDDSDQGGDNTGVAGGEGEGQANKLSKKQRRREKRTKLLEEIEATVRQGAAGGAHGAAAGAQGAAVEQGAGGEQGPGGERDFSGAVGFFQLSGKDKRKVAAQAASLFPQDSLAHSYAKEGLGDFKITELLGMQHYLQERGIDRSLVATMSDLEKARLQALHHRAEQKAAKQVEKKQARSQAHAQHKQQQQEQATGAGSKAGTSPGSSGKRGGSGGGWASHAAGLGVKQTTPMKAGRNSTGRGRKEKKGGQQSPGTGKKGKRGKGGDNGGGGGGRGGWVMA